MIKWFIPITLFLLISCNREGRIINTRPSGVLDKETMIDLLVDINLAESALRVGTIEHDMTSDSIYQKSQFIEVFKKHNVLPDDYDKSLTYYTQHVTELNEIYLEVISRLSIMSAKLEATTTSSGAAKTPKKDSIK